MAFVVFSPHTFNPSSHCRQPGSPESSLAGFPAPVLSPLQTLNFLPLCENCLSGPKASLPHHARVSVCEAKADTFVSFSKCWEATLPALLVPVPGPLSVAWRRWNRQVQVPLRKCGWIFNWQREALGNCEGWGWAGGRETERGRWGERKRTALLFFVLTNPVL